MKKVGTAFLTTLFIFSSFTSANAEEKKDSKAFIDVSAATLWTNPLFYLQLLLLGLITLAFLIYL
ncbi:hypothetical protein ACT453_24895, partial [Bacillus sp. D-CC]